MNARQRWNQLHRDIRVINRGDVATTTYGLTMRAIDLAVYPAQVGPRYHEVDSCVRYLGSERDIDQRKRAARRIRHYNAMGHSFSEMYAARLP